MLCAVLRQARELLEERVRSGLLQSDSLSQAGAAGALPRGRVASLSPTGSNQTAFKEPIVDALAAQQDVGVEAALIKDIGARD